MCKKNIVRSKAVLVSLNIVLKLLDRLFQSAVTTLTSWHERSGY